MGRFPHSLGCARRFEPTGTAKSPCLLLWRGVRSCDEPRARCARNLLHDAERQGRSDRRRLQLSRHITAEGRKFRPNWTKRAAASRNRENRKGFTPLVGSNPTAAQPCGTAGRCRSSLRIWIWIPTCTPRFAQFERRLIAKRTREDAREQTDAGCPAGLGAMGRQKDDHSLRANTTRMALLSRPRKLENRSGASSAAVHRPLGRFGGGHHARGVMASRQCRRRCVGHSRRGAPSSHGIPTGTSAAACRRVTLQSPSRISTRH